MIHLLIQGVEVVALNEQVLAVGIAAGQFGHRLQQPPLSAFGVRV